MPRYEGTPSYEVSKDHTATWQPVEVEEGSWLQAAMKNRSALILFYPQDGFVYRIRYTPNEES